QQAQQHETTINPNNLERLINLMVVSIQKQDEMNQKLFNLINRLVPVVERIEQHLGRGATLNNETKLQRNVSFRNKYCNKQGNATLASPTLY
ncbi:unnamed protein product, partial [Rotaria sp. Silwood2]